MPDKWFFTRDGKQRLGPFTKGQLSHLAATGQLTPSDMVLKEGDRKWAAAHSIAGLFSPSRTPASHPPATKASGCSRITFLRETSEEAKEHILAHRKQPAKDALTVLAAGYFDLFGMSPAFTQMFSSLEEIMAHVEEEDWDGCFGAIMAHVVKLRAVEKQLS